MTRRFLLKAILIDKSSASREALKYLNDERWYVRRNMLQILIEIGQGDRFREVRRLCRDAQEKVRIKAIQYLLLHDDPYAIHILKGYLHSKSPGLIDYAIYAAKSFKVGELSPDLLDLLDEKNNSKISFSVKSAIVEALAAIGDPSCLPVFKAILSRRPFLFRESHNRLKRRIYDALASFDPDHTEDLIEMGLASEDEAIQALCKKIAKQHAELNRSKNGGKVDER